VTLGVAVPALWGLAAGWWTPRGPLTTVQVLAAMAVGLAVGAAAGFVLRSRWSMLLSPLVFAVVFELTWIGTNGPTVDAPAASTYGVFAVIVGRASTGWWHSPRWCSAQHWVPGWRAAERLRQPESRCLAPESSTCAARPLG